MEAVELTGREFSAYANFIIKVSTLIIFSNLLFKMCFDLTFYSFIFCYKFCFLRQNWLPARSIVEKSVADRFKVDPSGAIIKLDQFCPWREHIFDIPGAEDVLYVIFGGQDSWSFIFSLFLQNFGILPTFSQKLPLKEDQRRQQEEGLVRKPQVSQKGVAGADRQRAGPGFGHRGLRFCAFAFAFYLLQTHPASWAGTRRTRARWPWRERASETKQKSRLFDHNFYLFLPFYLKFEHFQLITLLA